MKKDTAITDYLASIGCEFPEIGLLQPADPILDTAGEDLRRRIFLTQENSGKLMCLRPEFTIPVGLAHLESGVDVARYGYVGTVFRQDRAGASEFIQTGFEDLGNPDRLQADMDTISAAIGALENVGQSDFGLVLGNQAVFSDLLEQLEIPQAWRKKLLRGFGEPSYLHDLLSGMVSGNTMVEDLPETLKPAIDSGDLNQLVTEIAKLMQNDGLPLTGGRTSKAIAERLMEKCQLASDTLDTKSRSTLESFLAIDVPLEQAPDALEKLAQHHGLNLEKTITQVKQMEEGLAAHQITKRYKASFGRRLDYYTGLVFEIYRAGNEKPVAGGGRYDRLMTLLGAKQEIPAVGFAIWMDRLEKKS